MTTHIAPPCAICKHLKEGKVNELTCKAFPEGIPADVLTWKADHRDEIEGDHGVRFEVIKGKEKLLKLFDEIYKT